MSKLKKQISYILKSPVQTYRKLQGGLILSYTPPDQNEQRIGYGRFLCSREGNIPSADEVEIVGRDLKAALKEADRPYENLTKSNVKQQGNYNYVVLEWHDGQQHSLV